MFEQFLEEKDKEKKQSRYLNFELKTLNRKIANLFQKKQFENIKNQGKYQFIRKKSSINLNSQQQSDTDYHNDDIQQTNKQKLYYTNKQSYFQTPLSTNLNSQAISPKQESQINIDLENINKELNEVQNSTNNEEDKLKKINIILENYKNQIISQEEDEFKKDYIKQDNFNVFKYQLKIVMKKNYQKIEKQFSQLFANTRLKNILQKIENLKSNFENLKISNKKLLLECNQYKNQHQNDFNQINSIKQENSILKEEINDLKQKLSIANSKIIKDQLNESNDIFEPEEELKGEEEIQRHFPTITILQQLEAIPENSKEEEDEKLIVRNYSYSNKKNFEEIIKKSTRKSIFSQNEILIDLKESSQNKKRYSLKAGENFYEQLYGNCNFSLPVIPPKILKNQKQTKIQKLSKMINNFDKLLLQVDHMKFITESIQRKVENIQKKQITYYDIDQQNLHSSLYQNSTKNSENNLCRQNSINSKEQYFLYEQKLFLLQNEKQVLNDQLQDFLKSIDFNKEITLNDFFENVQEVIDGIKQQQKNIENNKVQHVEFSIMRKLFNKIQSIILDHIYRLETNSKFFHQKNNKTKKLKQFQEYLKNLKLFIGLIFEQLQKAYKTKGVKKNNMITQIEELKKILNQVNKTLENSDISKNDKTIFSNSRSISKLEDNNDSNIEDLIKEGLILTTEKIELRKFHEKFLIMQQMLNGVIDNQKDIPFINYTQIEDQFLNQRMDDMGSRPTENIKKREISLKNQQAKLISQENEIIMLQDKINLLEQKLKLQESSKEQKIYLKRENQLKSEIVNQEQKIINLQEMVQDIHEENSQLKLEYIGIKEQKIKINDSYQKLQKKFENYLLQVNRQDEKNYKAKYEKLKSLLHQEKNNFIQKLQKLDHQNKRLQNYLKSSSQLELRSQPKSKKQFKKKDILIKNFKNEEKQSKSSISILNKKKNDQIIQRDQLFLFRLFLCTKLANGYT